jgi:hypothetical protein
MLIGVRYYHMSAQNPFRIPSCFKLDTEQRRRERFKKAVVTVVIVSVAVVIGLLIEGCVSEKSSASIPDNSTQTPAQMQTAPAIPQTQPQPTISKTGVPHNATILVEHPMYQAQRKMTFYLIWQNNSEDSVNLFG